MQRDHDYTIQMLADAIRRSPKTVWAWVKTGKLKTTRYGRIHFIAEADWLDCLARFNSKEE
jgi:hypothetical protein